MLECLIVGDSIAVGVSQVRPECQSIAKSGINSRDWNNKHLHKLKPARTLVISLGANDLGMMSVAGLSVAFCAKPIVRENAKIALNERDLAMLIPLLP